MHLVRTLLMCLISICMYVCMYACMHVCMYVWNALCLKRHFRALKTYCLDLSAPPIAIARSLVISDRNRSQTSIARESCRKSNFLVSDRSSIVIADFGLSGRYPIALRLRQKKPPQNPEIPKKTPRLRVLFRKLRANFCLLPGDTSQEPNGKLFRKNMLR